MAELFGVFTLSRTARQQGWLGKAAAGLPQSKVLPHTGLMYAIYSGTLIFPAYTSL